MQSQNYSDGRFRIAGGRIRRPEARYLPRTVPPKAGLVRGLHAMNERILIIDDDELIRKTYRERFAADGFSVEEALSAKEGLDKIKGNVYSAAAIDIRMPEIDGISLTRRIREFERESAAADPEGVLRRMPIVLLTASKQAEEEGVALGAGADAYFGKDTITPKQLSEFIQELLRRGTAP